ncbi:hypothetical protein VIGAN_10039000 [Vigna angularis var. angularis]|uniref:F-box domain-containing protein n=1 Tax=Vigna angularis var. angularis TaxID=157739 RepID=A0A0S3T1H3_PHAAN|nr:hypothetical protein VIGAN_10039000 [Vigna angularis var. angularis]
MERRAKVEKLKIIRAYVCSLARSLEGKLKSLKSSSMATRSESLKRSSGSVVLDSDNEDMLFTPNFWPKKHSWNRKSPENEDFLHLNGFPLDDLNEDLLERVLSWLPTSSFFRHTSVSKRWKSAAASVSFKLAYT